MGWDVGGSGGEVGERHHGGPIPSLPRPSLISSRHPLGELLQRHLHQIRGGNLAASFSGPIMAPAWVAVCKLLWPAKKQARFDRAGSEDGGDRRGTKTSREEPRGGRLFTTTQCQLIGAHRTTKRKGKGKEKKFSELRDREEKELKERKKERRRVVKLGVQSRNA